MNFIRRFLCFVLIGCLLVVITACTRNLKEAKFVQPNITTNLLIAGDASEFKDGIRNAIIKRYQDTCNIDIVNIDRLPETNSADYDAVLIMDTCLAWSHFNKSVKEFLDEAFSYAGLSVEKHVRIDKKYFRPTETEELLPDTTKARRKINWSPKVKFRDLVKIMVDADMRKEGLKPKGEGDIIIEQNFPNRWWGID